MPGASSSSPWESIAKSELLQSLAAAGRPATTVLTPNARLAQSLAAEFDAAQAAAGKTAWETADILPFSSFVERLYEDALHDERHASSTLPVLLTPAQEHSLWEQAIAASPWGGDQLLALAPTAGEAARAWALAHEWRIADEALKASSRFPRNEDAQAFMQWAAQYRRRCERERHIDMARLPDLVMKLLPDRDESTSSDGPLPAREGALPARVVAYAFDILPPQTRVFLNALAARGVEVRVCSPERREATVTRWPFPSARTELETAARWARARLERAASAETDPSKRHAVRIGIVVPDLAQRRKEVARVLERTLAPGTGITGGDKAQHAPLFNLSLGLPLPDYPLVHAALGLIELACAEITFTQASRLLRSPFLRGAQEELMPRARLDAALRREAPPRLTLARLLTLVHGDGRAARAAALTPKLQRRLGAMLQYARDHFQSRKSAMEWAQHFALLLAAGGFPAGRALDSAEYQTHVKWTETLAQFARLGRVLPALSAREAHARLAQLVASTLFQPNSGGAPIQVLGILESDGLAFDHLWVCGLTDEAWPLAARPHPFLPIALQREAGMPQASAEGALALDRRITANWLGAAEEVILSHALHTEDRELSVSPLVAELVGVPEGALDLPAYPAYRDLLFAARALEFLPGQDAEERAPALAAGGEARGGASVLSDQAACAFRAFARHRLDARPLEDPAPGLDAAARGTLLHALMKGIWDELKNKARLDSIPPDELNEVIDRAAEAAVARVRNRHSIGDAFADLERKRLARLAMEWLTIERRRPDFTVTASEEPRKLHAGGLILSGRIDRLDRLASGGHALIDYKSGAVTPKSWLGERPDDPQLPLYAVSAAEPIDAVIFAKLKTGGMKIMGFTREERMLPGAQKALDWNALLNAWRKETAALGTSFLAGEAEVDPKKGALTCRLCALAPLCRVHEKFYELDDEDDGASNDGPGDAA